MFMTTIYQAFKFLMQLLVHLSIFCFSNSYLEQMNDWKAQRCCITTVERDCSKYRSDFMAWREKSNSNIVLAVVLYEKIGPPLFIVNVSQDNNKDLFGAQNRQFEKRLWYRAWVIKNILYERHHHRELLSYKIWKAWNTSYHLFDFPFVSAAIPIGSWLVGVSPFVNFPYKTRSRAEWKRTTCQCPSVNDIPINSQIKRLSKAIDVTHRPQHNRTGNAICRTCNEWPATTRDDHRDFHPPKTRSSSKSNRTNHCVVHDKRQGGDDGSMKGKMPSFATCCTHPIRSEPNKALLVWVFGCPNAYTSTEHYGCCYWWWWCRFWSRFWL